MTQPPTAEYCFLWIDWWVTCMTKSEWSGWAQAIGATVGLALTLWLWRQSNQRDRSRAIYSLFTFAGAAASSYPQIFEAFRDRKQNQLRLPVSLLRQRLDLAKQIDVSQLKSADQQVALSMLCAIVELTVNQCESALMDAAWAVDRAGADSAEVFRQMGTARSAIQGLGLSTTPMDSFFPDRPGDT